MIDRRTQVMSWLEGLTFDDWSMYHSDSEVQEIAKEAFALINEQANDIHHMGLIIEEYEHELAITQDNLNYYINGNN